MLFGQVDWDGKPFAAGDAQNLKVKSPPPRTGGGNAHGKGSYRWDFHIQWSLANTTVIAGWEQPWCPVLQPQALFYQWSIDAGRWGAFHGKCKARGISMANIYLGYILKELYVWSFEIGTRRLSSQQVPGCSEETINQNPKFRSHLERLGYEWIPKGSCGGVLSSVQWCWGLGPCERSLGQLGSDHRRNCGTPVSQASILERWCFLLIPQASHH